MIRKTKIVCTLGPACESVAILSDLLRAGMNVARFNFSHGNHEEHKRRIETLREASRMTGIPVALLLDTKGPQIRTGKVKDNGVIHLKDGQQTTISMSDVEGDAECFSVNYKGLARDVRPQTHILIADGLIDLEVIECNDQEILCLVRNGGKISSNKNVNVVGVKVGTPAITKHDEADISFGAQMDMDFVAASFVQTADDITRIQDILDKEESSMKIIAKIETRESLENILSITMAATGVMVARGDLGIQLTTEEIPLSQKKIIRVCNQYGKVVITATQLLDSMIHNPRPTRAEATDVANAIFDGTDAVMLSGETASGKFPIESVKVLHKIALTIENSREYHETTHRYMEMHSDVENVGMAVAKTVHFIAKNSQASAIISPSLRGNSPRIISRYRPVQPIVATTTIPSVFRSLLLYWGVEPFLIDGSSLSFETILEKSIEKAIERGIVKRYDFVAVTAGLPLDSPVMLNTIRMHFVGEILQRGSQGYGGFVEGKIVSIKSTTYPKDITGENTILMLSEFTPNIIPLLKHTRGLIITNPMRSLDSIIYPHPHLVVVAGLLKKSVALNEAQWVGISGSEKIVYRIDDKDAS